MKNDIFTEFINSPDFSISTIEQGLTNYNFLINANKHQYILRLAKKDAACFISRQHEKQVIDTLKNKKWFYDVVYVDQNSGTLISKYINNALPYEESTNPNKIKMVASVLRDLHSLKTTINFDFDPIKHFNNYASQLKSLLYPIKNFQHILDEVAKLNYVPTLCHNDLVSGNIMCTTSEVVLIDFEYAGNNDPLFDVMSFLSENNITDKSQRNIFYSIYFDELNQDLLNRLSLWESFHNLLWCTWALLMYQSRNEIIYKSIAALKWNALQKCIK